VVWPGEYAGAGSRSISYVSYTHNNPTANLEIIGARLNLEFDEAVFDAEAKGRVAVVIVGHNEAAWIQQCLASVVKEVAPGSVFYVDNASSDGTLDIVRMHFSGIRLLENEKNLGFAAGNNSVLNKLMMADAYDYAFLLNPDAALPAGVLESLTKFMTSHEQYAAVGPLQVEYDGTQASDRLNRVSRRDIAIGKYHILKRWLPDVTLQVTSDHPSGILSVYYVQGSAFFVRIEALREIGLFDEMFHSFYEEVDLCRRALWAGQKLGILTTIRLPHASRGQGSRSRWRLYLRLRNKYLFTLTDVNIAVRWIPVVIFRLVLSDFRGAFRSIGAGDLSIASSAMAALWLVKNTVPIVRARRKRAKIEENGRPGGLIGRQVGGRAHLF
jgi:GT2 family glycosyltransferase